MKYSWPTKKLGEIAPFLRGSGLSKKDLASSGTRKCILYGQLYTMYGPVIDEVKSRTDKVGSMLSVAGDVLVPGTTTADEVGIAVASALNEGGVILGGDINIIRTENKLLNSKFLAYLLSGPYKMRLAKYARGTNIIHLSGKDIVKIEVPIPPAQTQKQIVERMDKIVAAQKLNDELIQKTDELFQSLLHKELNLAGPADAKAMAGKKNWEPKKLGEIAETSSGGTPLKERAEFYENGTIPWLRSGEVSQGLIYKSELFINENGLENSSAKIFPIDTVLVAMYGATAGQVGLLKFEASTNQAICGILPNDKFLPEYLYYFLKTQTNRLIQISTGGAQPNISQQVIRNIKVPLPDLKIQKKIVAKLSAVQDYKKQLLEQKSKLKELFDSALSKSMKGELDK